jgi:hypothetical protein
MTDFLDALGRQLVKAANEQSRDARAGSVPRRRVLPLRLVVTAAMLLLVMTAVALAATGVLGTGSPVSPPPGSSPTAGIGVPARGESRLLALSAPDPAGGLPWGMRIVHTTRDLVCVQIGRLYHGQLGLLGRDGAFGDDGRFHPLPPDAIAEFPGSGSTAAGAQDCKPPGLPFSDDASGIPQSGVISHTTVAASAQRWISFGLLGAHAQSVTYRSRGHAISEAVEPDTGAYLIVLPGHQPGTTGEQSGGSTGSEQSTSPDGALTAITYRFGATTCQDTNKPGAANSCPSAQLYGPPPGTITRRLHHPLGVTLQSSAGEHDTAIVTFTAPYQVTNTLNGYQIAMPSPCPTQGGGTVISPIDRNITAGERVRTRLTDVFANACDRTVVIQVLYGPGDSTAPGRAPTTIIGQATIKRPK